MPRLQNSIAFLHMQVQTAQVICGKEWLLQIHTSSSACSRLTWNGAHQWNLRCGRLRTCVQLPPGGAYTSNKRRSVDSNSFRWSISNGNYLTAWKAVVLRNKSLLLCFHTSNSKELWNTKWERGHADRQTDRGCHWSRSKAAIQWLVIYGNSGKVYRRTEHNLKISFSAHIHFPVLLKSLAGTMLWPHWLGKSAFGSVYHFQKPIDLGFNL